MLVPEVMVVDNIVAGIIRKDKISVSEIEDAIQSSDKGSIGLVNSIATLFVEDKIILFSHSFFLRQPLYQKKQVFSTIYNNFFIINSIHRFQLMRYPTKNGRKENFPFVRN